MADPVPLANGATRLDPVGIDDASAGGTSVDTMVVGAAAGDSGAGFIVGDPGLGANADSGGARASTLPPIGSGGSAGTTSLSGGLGNPSLSGSLEGGGVAAGGADSAALGGDQTAILGAGGIASAGAGAIAGTLAPTGSTAGAGNAGLSGGSSVEGGGVAASGADSIAPGSDETAILGAGGIAPAGGSAASGDMVTAAGVTGGAVESIVPGGGASSAAAGSVASDGGAGGAAPSGHLGAGATFVSVGSGGGDVWVVSGGTSSGLVYNVSFDQASGTLPTGFEADVISAFQYYADTFNDSGVTLYYNVGYGEVSGSAIGAGFLGESFTNFGPTQSYTAVRSALIADAKTSADSATVTNDLPVSDPTGGRTLDMAVAEEKALGLNVSGGGASFSNPDGYIGFNSAASTFDYISGQVPNSGTYDFIGSVEHEISEVMGRNSWLDLSVSSDYSVMDLFRFSGSGTHQFTRGNPSYFSTDGGATAIFNWNNYGSGNNGGDLGDWATTTPTYTPDAYNAFSNPNVLNPVTSNDTTVMDVIGWDVAPCYCRGTLIWTERGEVAVEDLAIGDEVVILAGEARPIKWIGRRAYDGRFVADNRAMLPIRIEAGALEDGVPARDLWVSPEHALYIDEVLVPARLLVNGATIRQVESVERLEYFHIELAAHELILAEGTPAETFVDCDNRFMFQNGEEFARLYPDDTAAPWEFCAMRLEESSAELTAIRAALLARAAALGDRFADDPDLHLIVDGEIVRPQAVAEEVYRFTVPAGSRAIWLASRSATPAEADSASQDRRLLGVPVERIVLRENDLRTEIGYRHASLCEGFHDDEDGYRWTDGMAQLPEEMLRPFWGDVTVEVHLTRHDSRYLLAAPAPAAAPPQGAEIRALSPGSRLNSGARAC